VVNIKQMTWSHYSSVMNDLGQDARFAGAAPTMAVQLLHQLRLLPQVFAPPAQLMSGLGQALLEHPCVRRSWELSRSWFKPCKWRQWDRYVNEFKVTVT